MTRFSRYGTDYTDPSAYSGTAGGLDRPRGGSLGRRASGSVLRTAGAVFLGIIAIVVAWNLLGVVIGTVFFALKLALLVGVLAAVVALFRRFR